MATEERCIEFLKEFKKLKEAFPDFLIEADCNGIGGWDICHVDSEAKRFKNIKDELVEEYFK